MYWILAVVYGAVKINPGGDSKKTLIQKIRLLNLSFVFVLICKESAWIITSTRLMHI